MECLNRVRTILFTILIIASIISFCGCTDRTTLASVDEIEDSLENQFKSVEILEIIPEKTDDGNAQNTYKVKYRDLEFEVNDYIRQNNLFGFNEAAYSNNYALSLYEIYQNELIELADSYNLNTSSTYNSITFKSCPNSFYDISNSIAGFLEVKDLLRDYLPLTSDGPVSFSLKLTLQIGDYISSVVISDNSDTDLKYADKLQRIKVAQAIRDRKITEGEFNYTSDKIDNIQPEKIRALYINGEELDIYGYSIEFTYDIYTEKYYIPISFEDNENSDALHRKILDNLYKDTYYSIDNKSNTIKYMINNTKYTIEKQDSKIKAYKGFKAIELDQISTVNGNAPENSKYAFISADSLAELTGLTLINIDKDGVYMESK